MYWEHEQEITLLQLVLENLDPDEHAATADYIICGLIEMELVDCCRAPTAQQAWRDEWKGFGVSRGFLTLHYLTHDEVEDEYACLDCDFETTDTDEMNDHIDAKHPENYGLTV